EKKRTYPSVTWHARIDLRRPGVDAAGKRRDRRYPRLFEERRSAQAADAVMAVDDDGRPGRRMDLVQSHRQFAEWNKHAIRQPTNRMFLRLTHVQEEDGLAGIELRFQFAGVDFAGHGLSVIVT